MAMAKAHDARLAALEQRLGHVFADRSVLREALTHGSVFDTERSGRSYDRLEFLGDRVLGLIVAERLLHENQDDEEGDLAQRARPAHRLDD